MVIYRALVRLVYDSLLCPNTKGSVIVIFLSLLTLFKAISLNRIEMALS